MAADCISSVKDSLDVLFTNPAGMDMTVNAMATRAITLNEVWGLAKAMATSGNRGMHPKHKMCYGILRAMKSRLDRNAPGVGADIGNMKLDVFGRDMVEFLTAMHKVMSHGTKERARKTFYKSFITGKTLPKVHATAS